MVPRSKVSILMHCRTSPVVLLENGVFFFLWQGKSSNEEFSYDNLATAMAGDGLSESDLDMEDNSEDDMPSPAGIPSSEGEKLAVWSRSGLLSSWMELRI